MAKQAKKEVKKTEAPKADNAHLTRAIGKAEEMLEQTIVELIFAEPFYANLIMGMRREFTSSIPTLGVNVTDQVNLFINPYFFCALNLPQRIDILKHECGHVINNHFVRFRDLEPKVFSEEKKSIVDRIMDMQKATTTNKAADAALNEYLPNLPRKFKMFDENGNVVSVPLEITDENGNKIPNPDKNAGKPLEAEPVLVDLLKKKFPNIEERQTMEYYYEFLKEQQQNGNGEGMDQFIVIDDHDLWHQSDNTEDDITQKVKDAVNKAVEQTSDKDMGKLPSDVISSIEKLNHVPKDWRQDVQRFSARCAEILIESTRKKRNRRYGILYAGNKTYPKLQLTVAIDTSGSVGNEELTQFHAEMIRLYNMGIDLTVIQCDTSISSVDKFDPKKDFKVHGRGGTAFAPVFEYVEKNKLETDGLIYFTDGACWNENIKKPKYPVLWALTAPFTLDSSITFGSKTKVEVNKRVRR